MTFEEFAERFRALTEEIDRDVPVEQIQTFLFGIGIALGEANGYPRGKVAPNFIWMASKTLKMETEDACEALLRPMLEGAGVELDSRSLRTQCKDGYVPRVRRGQPRRGDPRRGRRKGKKR